MALALLPRLPLRARCSKHNITGGADLSLFDVTEASNIITEAVDPEANIIFGAVIDENLKDEIRVTVIATGFNKEMPTHGGKAPVTRPGGGYTQPHDNDAKPHVGGSGIIHKHTNDTEIPPWIRG